MTDLATQCASSGNPDKNNPPAWWIQEIRKRFPCEPETDRILTRKMQHRGGPAFAPVSIETLVKGTASLIRANIGADFEITQPRWLSGGASKLQLAFDLDWNKPNHGLTRTSMVLRMEPAESISETSRRCEFDAISSLQGHIPVPPTFWVDPDAFHLPYPAIIYGFIDGVTKPTASNSNVTGLGTFFPTAIRETLSDQFVEHCAKLHSLNPDDVNLGAIDIPSSREEAISWQLNHWERVWEEDSGEDVPLMRLAMAWMRCNLPECDRLSLIHGDFRTGNFLYTEQDSRITAWLDWEYAHLGDRHEDLSWTIKPVFGRYDDDGTLLIAGLLPLEEFFERYENLSGLSVDRKRLRFYNIFNSFKGIAICLATGTRIARNGKTHQDVLTAWLAGISYVLLEELRQQLREVL